MRLIILFCLFMLATIHTAQAASCIPIKVPQQNKNFMLSNNQGSGGVQIYFFKNIGKQGVWIDHPVTKRMNAGWSSYLQSGHWSAFLLNRKDFDVSCAIIQPGNMNYLDCARAISVCAPREAIFVKPPKGSYWLAEDKSWDELVKAIEKRGVSLK